MRAMTKRRSESTKARKSNYGILALLLLPSSDAHHLHEEDEQLGAHRTSKARWVAHSINE